MLSDPIVRETLIAFFVIVIGLLVFKRAARLWHIEKEKHLERVIKQMEKETEQ